MRLPLSSWTNTLTRLGFKRRRKIVNRRRNISRPSQFEPLEQRVLLTSDLTLTGPGSVNENELYTLQLDAGATAANQWSIDWGDGNTDSFNVTSTTLTADHVYADDDPTGTASDSYAINASVTYVDSSTASETMSVTVDNLAPSVSDVTFSLSSETEPQVLTIDNWQIGHSRSGTWYNRNAGFGGQSLYATHSASQAWWSFSTESDTSWDVYVTWPTHSLADTSVQYAMYDGADYLGTVSKNHAVTPDDGWEDGRNWEYLGEYAVDDGPLKVRVSGATNGKRIAADAVRIKEVVPANAATPITSVNEGESVKITGSVTDASIADSHTIDIDWGDTTTSSVTPINGTFTADHTYVDDDPTNTPNDVYNIQVTATDDDTGVTVQSVPLTVKNEPPQLVLETVGPLSDTAPVTITGYLGDTSSVDTHSLLVDWGDGATETIPVTLSATVPQDVRTVDDGGSGFSHYSFNYQGIGGYAGDYRLGTDTGDYAWWTFGGLDPGVWWDVYVTYTNSTSRATSSKYTIYDNGVQEKVKYVNQTVAPSGLVEDGRPWTHLGKYRIDSGTLKVKLTGAGNGKSISADAIRIKGPPPPLATPAISQFTVQHTYASNTLNDSYDVSITAADDDSQAAPLHTTVTAYQVIDDGDAGFSTTAGWSHATAPSRPAFETDIHYKAAGSGAEQATWTFTGLPAGQYQVSTTWTEHSNRATDAPFTLLDGATERDTVLVNQEDAPRSDAIIDGTNFQNVGEPITVDSGTLVVRLTDDADEYVFADAVHIQRVMGPEVVVRDGTEIVQADSVVDFGTAYFDNPGISKIFTVINQGESDLTLTPIDPQGLPLGFSLISNLGTTQLATGESTTFTVEFTESEPGTYGGTLALGTNDWDESLFSFSLAGAATDFLVIDDGDPGFSIAGADWSTNTNGFAGDQHWSAAGSGVDQATWTLSNVPVGRYQVSATWTPYSNRATDAPFTLLDGSTERNTVLVNQEPAPAADIVIDDANFQHLGNPVMISSGTITVRLTDAANETVMADAVHIQLLPPSPEIEVFHGATALVHGSSVVDFGVTTFGNDVDQTFTIQNDGNLDLAIAPIDVATLPPGFILLQDVTSNLIAPSGSATFTIRMDGSNPGLHAGTISLINSDLDEGPFEFTIFGEVDAIPEVAALSALPGPFVLGSPLTLTATGVRDPGGQVQEVRFYYDADDDGQLQTATDTLLDSDWDAYSGWSVAVDTSTFAAGSHRFFAVASDGTWDSNVVQALAEAVPSTALTLYPAADAFVRGGSYSSDNYGSDALLTVRKNSDTSNNRQAFLTFDLASVTDDITEATLRLHPVSMGSGTVTHYANVVPDVGWQEGTITWTSRPDADAYLPNWTVSDLSPVEIDLTDQVRRAQQTGDNLFSIRIDSSSYGVHVDYGSREGASADRPELVLSTVGNNVAPSLGDGQPTRYQPRYWTDSDDPGMLVSQLLKEAYDANVLDNPGIAITAVNSADGVLQYTLAGAATENEVLQGLMAHWRFDETAGSTANDSSPHWSEVTGTLAGDAAWVTGQADGGLQLDGDGDYVSLPSSLYINDGIFHQRTLSGWFRVDDATLNTRKQVIYEQGDATRGLNIYVFDGRLYVGGWNTQESGWSGTFLSTNAVTSGQWHHVALTLDGSSTVQPGALTAYLDGSAFDSGDGSLLWRHGAATLGRVTSDTLFHDGAAIGDGHEFAGTLDELRVYNRTLSDAEVSHLAGNADIASVVWQAVDPVSDTSALLLPADGNTRIRFRPSSEDFVGQTSDVITFRAWDQTSGVPGDRADVNVLAASSAVGEAMGTGSFLVTPEAAPELIVNEDTSGYQGNPDVASDAAGNFVVVWSGDGSSGQVIYGQRFDVNGDKVGGQFSVSSLYGYSPSVGMDDAGNFVVAWSAYDGSYTQVYARRFDANATPLTSEFQVDPGMEYQGDPSIAVEKNGEFVVVWTEQSDIYARRFFMTGSTAIGDAFQVNSDDEDITYVSLSYTGGDVVAVDDDGRFTIVWKGYDSNLAADRIYSRRYDASGIPGDEFIVSDLGFNYLDSPTLAASGDGDLSIGWVGYSNNGLSSQRMRRYDSSGLPEGPELEVESVEGDAYEYGGVVAYSDNGDAVVVWNRGAWPASEGAGIFARWYDPAGQPATDAALISTFQVEDSYYFSPSVASAAATGNYLVTWESYLQDGDDSGVIAQLTSFSAAPTTIGIDDVVVEEDDPPTVIDLLSRFDDLQETSAGLAFTILDNSNPGIFAQPDGAEIDSLLKTLALTYAPDASGTSDLVVRATDTDGFSVDATFTVTVNPVNDAPEITVPGTQSTTQNTQLVFDAARLISIGDIDADLAPVEVTLTVTSGTASLNGTDGTLVCDRHGQ